MPIDDSFLKKEANKRRMMTIMLILLFVNLVTVTVVYFSGLFRADPVLARTIIYSEVGVFVILYFVFKRKLDKDDRS